MPKNTYFQDYWLTDPSFKLWVRKSANKTTFCSYYQKKIDVIKVERVHLNDMQGWHLLKIKTKTTS